MINCVQFSFPFLSQTKKPFNGSLTGERTPMKFGLSSAALFPLPMGTVLRRISQAGFDFAEIFLMGRWSTERIVRLYTLAGKLNLNLRFHEVWNEKSDKSARVASLLFDIMGWVPWNRVPVIASPVVVYADRCLETPPLGRGFWFQTISTRYELTGVPRYRIFWKNFAGVARERKLPLVFDTMHFLEFRNGTRGVQLLTTNPAVHLDHLKEFWSEFGPQVVEIHWNDFDPRRGEAGGRNLWPGAGNAPLDELAKFITDSKWQGSVVPEVRPRLPFPYGEQELLALRRRMDKYFG